MTPYPDDQKDLAKVRYELRQIQRAMNADPESYPLWFRYLGSVRYNDSWPRNKNRAET